MTVTWAEIVLLMLTAAVIGLLAALLIQQRGQRSGERLNAQQQASLINQVADELLDALDSEKGAMQQALRDASAAQGQLGQAQQAQFGTMLETIRQLDARMAEMRRENAAQLSEMQRSVDERLAESLDRRLGESFELVSRRLDQVSRGLGEMQSLAAGVSDLRKVFANVKTRGVWGEVQLGSLLSEILAPGQYETNVCVVPGSQERVEFAIRLPGRDGSEVWLPIDAKFPQEDWLRLQDASAEGDAAAAEQSRRALRARLKTEAKRIASKYVAPPYSTDFAVMFLPVEGLYAEAVRDAGLMEELQRDSRIVMAGPSTFAALLNALQMGFRTLAIEQRSGEVWQLLGEVRGDFGRFADTLEKTRQRLQQASESMDTAMSRTNAIRGRLNSLDLDAGAGDAPSDP